MSKSRNPIPPGYYTVTVSLNLRDAARAIEFYKRAFGAEEVSRLAGPDGKIVHAELKIGDSRLMLGEECPQVGARSPQTVGGTTCTIHLYVPDVDRAFARAVNAGATPIMPLADMFWGDRYGKVKDPFGHEWSMGARQEDLTQEQIVERAKAAFARMSPPS